MQEFRNDTYIGMKGEANNTQFVSVTRIIMPAHQWVRHSWEEWSSGTGAEEMISLNKHSWRWRKTDIWLL